MKNLTLTAFVSLFAMTAIAAGPKKTDPSVSTVDMTQLRKLALAETQLEGKAQDSATTARTEGMLSLKDPRPEVITRSWKYSFGFTLQNFQPEGSVKSDLVGTFDLGNAAQTILPAIELGALSPLLTTGPLKWRLGGKGKFAYSSQKNDVILPSGYAPDDTRLNTSMASVGPAFTVQGDRLSWLALTGNYLFGDLNYTQTSSSDMATFSKHAGFTSLGLGLQFQLTKSWALSTEWSERKIRSDETIALQRNNFELGTNITW
jgi:hypothetical protein